MKEDPTRKAQGRRLSAARKDAGFRSAREAALENGWAESSYRAHESGTRTIGFDDAERYAKRYRSKGVGVDASVILLGAKEARTVSSGMRVVGYAGANARADVIVFTTDHGDLADDVRPPPGANENTVALQVRGSSMRNSAKDGWYICFDEDEIQYGPFDNLLGEQCVVWLADGRILYKELSGGQNGAYDLVSLNDDILKNQFVEKAVKVRAIVPNGRLPTTDRLVASDEGPAAKR